MSDLAVTLIAAGALAVLLKLALMLWARRHARQVEAKLEAMRQRQRRKAKIKEDKLAKPIEWAPCNDHLDVRHLQVRNEPSKID